MEFDFNKMKYLARKGERPVEMDEAYEVHEPWCLGCVELEEEEVGITTIREYNSIYSSYVPIDFPRQPSLFIQSPKPFWEISNWSLFKKRVKGFTKMFEELPTVSEEDLEDLKKGITGEWINE